MAEKIRNVDKALKFCKYHRGKFSQKPWRPGVKTTEIQGAAPPASSLGREDATSGLRWMERQESGTFYFIFILILFKS